MPRSSAQDGELQTLPEGTVLILGAGLAGLFLALRLAPRPALVVTPEPPGEMAASAWAQGGVAAALGRDDAPVLHAADTIAAGAGLVDPRIAERLASMGPDLVHALAALGAPFDRTPDGGFALSREAAHSRARVARVKGDLAGRAVMAAVVRGARASPGVRIEAGWRAVSLLVDANGWVAGALLSDRDGRLRRVRAGWTVLASGGLGGLYAVTTNPPSARGLGLAMAARAGAVIADAEFVQFHPTAIDVGRDPAPLATEALRGEGARLVDEAGEEICDPLAPRDEVARAVHRARETGRGALLDARAAIGAALPQRFPAVFAACQEAGLDPRRALIPIAPAAHYHMGGIATREDASTSLPGLWAVGECASTGAHGANRLASNSLLEALVFGHSAAQALRDGPPAARAPLAPVANPQSLPPAALAVLRQAMSAQAGVVRDAGGLSALVQRIGDLAAAHGGADELLVASLIASAALARRESRGAHYRSDYPALRDPPRRSFLRVQDGAPAPAEPIR